MPHGTMWSNMARSGSTLSANPWRVRPPATLTPIAAIFSSPTQTPVNPASRARLDAEVGERADEHRLERAHVGDDVAQTVAPRRQRDDRVADELTGAVVRDVAAAVGADELGAHRVRAARARARDRRACRACTRAGARAGAGSRRRSRGAARAGGRSPPRTAPGPAQRTRNVVLTRARPPNHALSRSVRIALRNAAA